MKLRNKLNSSIILDIVIFALAVFIIVCFIYIFNNSDEMNNITNAVTDLLPATEESKVNLEEATGDVVNPTIGSQSNNTSTINSDTSNYKYFYNQLDDNAKKMYNTIESNIENIKSGTYEIKLSSDIADVLKQSNGRELLNQEFQSSWDAIMTDRVDLFYIDVSKINLKIKGTTLGSKTKYELSMAPNEANYLETGFNNKNEVNLAINQLNEIRSQVVNQLSGDDYHKILQIHDCLVENFEYSTEMGNNAYNIYGGLIYKKVVCEGYAKTFKFLLDKIGIPCILVSGQATNSEGDTENHEWNYVQLNNKWYAVDVTWDDPILTNGGKLTKAFKYKYFLKGSNTFDENHILKNSFSTGGQEFTYPTIEQQDYK